MKRRLKSRLVGVFLVLPTLIAAGASVAVASENMHYHAPSAPTTITGVQTTQNKFTTSAGEVACTTVTQSGTQGSASATTLTFTSTLSGCTMFGFANSHFKMNDCDIEYTTPTTRLNSTQYTVAAPHLRCPAGQQIEFTPTVPIFGTSVCTMKFPPQTPTAGHVILSNQGSGNTRDILATFTISGIHYTVEGGGGLCGSSGTDGAYTGSMTLRGFQDTGGGHTNHNGVHEPIEVTGGTAP